MVQPNFVLAGTTGLDRNLHARQDPDFEDLPDPNLPSSLVAESARVNRHGPLSGMHSQSACQICHKSIFLPSKLYFWQKTLKVYINISIIMKNNICKS